jgi:hypothetical protein
MGITERSKKACLVLGDLVEGGHGPVVEDRHRRLLRRAADDDASQLLRPDAGYRARPHACVQRMHRTGR